MSSMSSRAALQTQARQRSKDLCEWPGHSGHRGVELSHFHSIGSGGNPDGSRDAPNNWGWFCWEAARASDGERGPGGERRYSELMLELLGRRYMAMVPSYVGWERAEALRRHIESRYPDLQE